MNACDSAIPNEANKHANIHTFIVDDVECETHMKALATMFLSAKNRCDRWTWNLRQNAL